MNTARQTAKRKTRSRRFAAVTLALTLLLVATSAFDRGARGQEGLPAELGSLVAAGADVSLLASATFGESPDNREALTLSRVVPGPPDALPLIIVAGPELWFVESGTAVLTGEDGNSHSFAAGEQGVLAEPGQYTVRFEGDNCPSALRLELSSVIAMRISTDEDAPSLGPDGVVCPAGGMLLEAVDKVTNRPVPALGFIARITWTQDTYVSMEPFSGPIGYAVESGKLQLSGPDNLNLGMAEGGWAVVAGGQSHWTFVPGTKPATAIVAGAFKSGVAAPTPTPAPTPVVGVHGTRYVSPSYGYTVSWDESWGVAGESTVPGSDSLQLSNGVNNVYFQSYGDFAGDAIACVDGIAAGLPGQAGFSAVTPRLTADGKAILGGDGTRRFAVYDFTYTTDTGSSRYTEYLECRVIVPGSSVLVITQIVLADDYPSQIEPMRKLLNSVSIP